MLRFHLAGFGFLFAGTLIAQSPAKVDFRRDVQPIFQAYCISCHGPSQQMNGLRLDRRRDAMRGGTITVIAPGNSAASRLYLRLIGNRYGTQMPLTGSLTADQINTIKTWIDQGADWPDDLSGDNPAPPRDPRATEIMEAMRAGNRPVFQRMLREFPEVGKLKGPGGATALMYAALYGDAGDVRALLEIGADPNVKNDAGATALMWAVDDLEKTKLLVQHGADVNALSDDKRTALTIAAGRYGSSAIVRFLLDHGADPSFEGARNFTPLAEAAYAEDEAVVQMLIDRGADLKRGARFALLQSGMLNCTACAEKLIASVDKSALGGILTAITPPRGGNAEMVRMLLDYGADPNAQTAEGRTILILAASSDTLPPEIVKSLIDRGADIHAKSSSGETALGLAQLHQPPVAELLLKAGATTLGVINDGRPGRSQSVPTVRDALTKSIGLLQRSDITFLEKSGCVSCHNNSLTGMTIGAARKNHLPVNENLVRQQLQKIGSYFDGWRERVLQGMGIPGDADTISYLLMGVAAEDYPSDASTDALARYLKNRQASDGRWRARDHRPPLTTSDIQITVRSMRAIQAYAPKPQRKEYENAIRRAASWLQTAQPRTTDDRAFQLLGLAWGKGDRQMIQRSAQALIAEQRPDGGWAQMPSLRSDAYATGETLVALKECGALSVNDSAYQKGIQFLLNTQLEDGSWHVKTRAIPIMPYFESDFSHGVDQFISAAATNWAVMALAPAAK